MNKMLNEVEAQTKELATSNPVLTARVLAQNSKYVLHILNYTLEVNELPWFRTSLKTTNSFAVIL